jgi:histidinol-phosphate phosphatase family protein
MKIIFLDRDGVINKYPGDSDYVKSWEEFSFLPRAKEALKKLYVLGFKIFVLSNQAGVGKGIYTQEALDLITKNMLEALSGDNIEISGVYYCTHRLDDNCICRKPKTGMIEMVKAKIESEGGHFNLGDTYFVGDSMIDVETGKNSGIKTVLLFSGKENPGNKRSWKFIPDILAFDLAEAVDLILNP